MQSNYCLSQPNLFSCLKDVDLHELRKQENQTSQLADLREDIAASSCDSLKATILENAAQTHNDFIVVPKVRE